MRKYPISNEFTTFGFLSATVNPITNDGRRKTKARNVKILSFDGKKIKCKVIEPIELKNQAPCIVYFHGGAFMYPAAAYHLRMAHKYAFNAKCKVVFVYYRLALRHPFPVPAEDAYSAVKWVYKNAQTLGIDVDRIAVAGDSAGGDLAAAVALMARDRGGPKICFQLLAYPVIDCDMETESMKEFIDTPIWDAKKCKRMWKVYLKNGDQGLLPYASPIKAKSLAGLPPAYIETAEFDPLRDEGINYARRLEQAGVSVELVQTKGTVHGYEMMFKSIAKDNFAKRITALNKVFGR